MTATTNPLHLANTGLVINDIREDKAFLARRINHRGAETQATAMQRLAQAILHKDKSVLQELVDIAVEICGADSAGLTLEEPGATDDACYRWIATAGTYNAFLHCAMPRYPSACGVSLERGGPQQFCAHQPFYDILGIKAPPITDGIVLPWRVDGMRGTLFILAHKRRQAFDLSDCRMMELLADFAALAIRQRRHQDAFLKQAAQSATTLGATGNQTDNVGNPQQSLTHMLYLAEGGFTRARSRNPLEYVPKPGDELPSLPALATRLLAVPYPGLKPR